MSRILNDGKSIEDNRRREEEDTIHQEDYILNELDPDLEQLKDVPSFVSDSDAVEEPNGMNPPPVRNSAYQDEFSNEPVIKEKREDR